MADNSIKGKVPPTQLSEDQLNCLLTDIASGLSLFKTIRKYHIGQSRYEILSNKYYDKIQNLRKEMALAKEKQFIDKSLLQRDRIIDSIAESDIKKASLHAKTGAIVDLTNVKRLEAGQSTINAEIIHNNLDDEELKNFILNGSLKVDNTVTPDK